MVLVIGHRGACAYEPENTLMSVEKAIELGVDAVEVDVRRTRDNKLVVIHDLTVDRTTNGRGYVRSYTLEELKNLDAGRGERIPSLDEVLELVSGRVLLLVEVKEEGTEGLVAEAISRHNAADWVMVVSFHPTSLKAIRATALGIKTGLIFSRDPSASIARAKTVGADAALPRKSILSPKLVESIKKLGMEAYTWVINSEQELEEALACGVDGVASDAPDVVINALRSKRA